MKNSTARAETPQHAGGTDRTEPPEIFAEDPAGAVEFGPDGLVISADAGFRRMLGREEDDLEGADLRSLLHPDDRAAFAERMDGIRTDGRPFVNECRYQDRDGRSVRVRQFVSVLPERAGEGERYIALVTDVTARLRTEEALRESEERFRNIANAAPVMIWMFDRVRELVWFNEPWLGFTGRTLEQEAGEGWTEGLHPDDRRRCLETCRAAFKARREFSVEYRLRRHDGEYRWLLDNGRPFFTRGGEFAGYIGSCIDITVRKMAEGAVSKSEERLRMILESASGHAIITTDLDGLVTRWNPGAERIFGHTEAEMLGRRVGTIYTPEDRERGVPGEELGTALRTGRAGSERWFQRGDGTRVFVSGVVSVLIEDKPEGFAFIATDLTREREMNEQLRRYRDELEDKVRERTRELAEAYRELKMQSRERRKIERERIAILRRLVTTQEDERRRIARDMHDQFGQQLTALRLKLEALKDLSGEGTELAGKIDRTQEIARQLDSDISFLVWELRPTALDDLGLRDAVRNYVRRWSKRFSIETDLHIGGFDADALTGDAETNLYRIVQEALNNISKYARASRVSVILRERNGKFELIVEDDGEGFDPETAMGRRRGAGISGMRERAALAGGELDLESAPGRGTTIFVRVPLGRNSS